MLDANKAAVLVGTISPLSFVVLMTFHSLHLRSGLQAVFGRRVMPEALNKSPS